MMGNREHFFAVIFAQLIIHPNYSRGGGWFQSHRIRRVDSNILVSLQADLLLLKRMRETRIHIEERKKQGPTMKSFFFNGAFSRIMPITSRHCTHTHRARRCSWPSRNQTKSGCTLRFLSRHIFLFFSKSPLIFFSSFSEISTPPSLSTTSLSCLFLF